MIPIKDMSVMITGSSRGIGAGIALYLSQLGAKVAVTYSHSRSFAEQVFSSLKGSGHLLLELDVTNKESVEVAFKSFMEHFKSISALINNAGITKDGLLLRMRETDFNSVLQTNLLGSFTCAKTAAKYMIKNRKGHIINISSVVARIGNPGQANYVASKAGIEGLTRSMANELASRNIYVNAIAPGFIETDMTQKLNPVQVKAITDKVPLKKLGSPQDVAETTAFLLSSEYITGQVIAVNGGLFLS